MKNNIKNGINLFAFAAILGLTCGLIVWLFLKVMSLGTILLWEVLPQKISFPYLNLVICIVGGLIIGLFHKKYGDYPEELDVVLGKIKSEKYYSYKNIGSLLFGAMLPLLIGSSVGPEAGLAGIIIALCYWAGDNLKFANAKAKEYSQIGIAASLSVLFHSPLFGLFEVEEASDDKEYTMPRSSKILIYGITIASATSIYILLGKIFGQGMGHFPSFAYFEPTYIDYFMSIVYIFGGILLGLLYSQSHFILNKISFKVPVVIRELIASSAIGLASIFAPILLFSGEEQMLELMETYGNYLPVILIIFAILKVFLTNLSIQFGLKGGHFFPLIFSGMLLGYGICLMTIGGESHVVFAAAIATASLLGFIMKKPIAVTMLLLICFPVRLAVWILFSASISKAISTHLHTKAH